MIMQAEDETVSDTILGKPTAPPKTGHEEIRQRRQARELALQSLYEIDSVQHKPGLVVDERLRENQIGKQGTSFFRWLVSGIVRNQGVLDQFISELAPDWPVNQLAVIDRNILRLALYEFSAEESDVPPKVIINEAVELAKLYGSDSSPRFINGVLGAALKDDSLTFP